MCAITVWSTHHLCAVIAGSSVNLCAVIVRILPCLCRHHTFFVPSSFDPHALFVPSLYDPHAIFMLSSYNHLAIFVLSLFNYRATVSTLCRHCAIFVPSTTIFSPSLCCHCMSTGNLCAVILIVRNVPSLCRHRAFFLPSSYDPCAIFVLSSYDHRAFFVPTLSIHCDLYASTLDNHAVYFKFKLFIIPLIRFRSHQSPACRSRNGYRAGAARTRHHLLHIQREDPPSSDPTRWSRETELGPAREPRICRDDAADHEGRIQDERRRDSEAPRGIYVRA